VTLDVLHWLGGSCSIALLLSRVARHYTPAGPICLRRWRGIALKPVLFSALKCLSSTADSSTWVMWLWVGVSKGVKTSGGMESS
jgi:hypothetical protein